MPARNNAAASPGHDPGPQRQTRRHGGGGPLADRAGRGPDNTALTNSRNNRWGMTFSNKIERLPSVDFTVGGHGQYEKLRLHEGDASRPWGLSRCGAGVSKRAGNMYQF